MSRQLCRFVQSPNGCRKGAKCPYTHLTTPNTGQSLPNSSNSGSDTPPLPPGACRNFWTKGNCRFEFQCRFRHISPGSHVSTQAPSSLRINLDNAGVREILAPFLTEDGLSKVNGIATDGFFTDNATNSLSPTEAQSRLRRFLADNFRYKSTLDVYAFLSLLSSASSMNKSWTQEDGQLLLGSLTTSNASLRIAEIVNWAQVSLHAGSKRDVLSFQRGILPLMKYMSSEFVIKSTLMTQTNHLYTVILQNFDKFAESIEVSLETAMDVKSFRDIESSIVYEPIDLQVFSSVVGLLHEFLTRFKNANADHPRLGRLVKNVCRWFEQWQRDVTSTPPAFNDPLKNIQPTFREYVLQSIKEKIDRLLAIISREEARLQKSEVKNVKKAFSDLNGPHEALVAALQTTYEGPGHLRPKGPRHDNDLEDINEIRIAPTNGELMCRLPPYLPANFFAAPHPAPPSSMQRLLDIQFRLLREELIAPLRQAVHSVLDDLESPRMNKTKLADLLKNQGGKYRGLIDSHNSLMFNIYTGVEFTSLVPDWKGMSTSLLIDTPPGRPRSDKSRQRAAFWESMSGKRLSQGGLIALVWRSSSKTSVYLGIIANSSKDLTDHVRQYPDTIKLRIIFFDTQIELRVLQGLRNKSKHPTNDLKLLVESPVMFEAIRPFLEALKTEPEDIPFSRYLVHQPFEILQNLKIEPPRYARLPNFTFKLSCLFDQEVDVDNNLALSVVDPHSIEHARTALTASRLDPSQADAMIDALTREVALIQGPPGTGKSFTGVEILRVLKANNVGPTLMIAFTNHALDHMLISVLDAGITTKVVRLGRRANDERIGEYSIETLEMASKNQSRLDRAFGSKRDLKDVQENVKTLMNDVLRVDLEHDSTKIVEYLSTYHPEHHENFRNPPNWLHRMRMFLSEDEDDQGGHWHRAGRKGKKHLEDKSIYAFWKECTDLDFIQQFMDGTFFQTMQKPSEISVPMNIYTMLPVEDTNEDDNGQVDDLETSEDIEPEEIWKAARYELSSNISDTNISNVQQLEVQTSSSPSKVGLENNMLNLPTDFMDIEGFFASIGFISTPSIPGSDRPLELLLDDGDIWKMSGQERHKLHNFWSEETRTELDAVYQDEFQRLRTIHADTLKKHAEIKEEIRRNLLKSIDIIGCTTTGAAQLVTLLKNVSPKVLLVEEAGQVLEAHVLGTLVPSVEHLIMIGDPRQLRPTLNNYSLSVDSKRGNALHKFDMSLMERLSSSGLAMSTINVQRRMRPSVSSLIRNTLYPTLEDHDLVKRYPNVRGLQQNVFFLTHTHKENDGTDDTASKYNTYEVKMICDLVLYLLRQGCYSNEGDIVVLCAYLGQLARLRDALAHEVAVVIDERDQAALDDQESEDSQAGATIERINVTKRVRLRTVDNYQGEEGRIVILSLVRNAGGIEDDMKTENITSIVRPTIGFLKSVNRTNVALSRAKEGLYIFGNAPILASRSQMWGSVIGELEAQDCVGPGLPIVCHRHSDTMEHISEPGRLPQIAPDGGCLRPCDTRLKCGHMCSFKCHCDDPNHLSVVCLDRCRRLCIRDHPCSKICSAECGQCHFPVINILLPCGHTKRSVECYKLEMLDQVFCDFQVEKALPRCEHTAVMACSTSPSEHYCSARCDTELKCCSKTCNAQCYECQVCNDSPTEGQIRRVAHKSHPCEKYLHCGHQCQEVCSESHQHTMNCTQRCRQSCVHAQCHRSCSTPCTPCQEPCAWKCPHYNCPVPCGSMCIRLPCDKMCTQTLKCGHRCPSVCGEDCSVQTCPECAPADKKDQVVDLILSRTLSDVMPELGQLDEMLITIPFCRHVFTVETLDGLMHINDFYRRNAEDTKWLGLQAPRGNISPPVCPTCRGPIRCNRYGRITKRADLDILERNVGFHMFQTLATWDDTAKRFNNNSATLTLQEEASKISIRNPNKFPAIEKIEKMKTARNAVFKNSKETPTSFNDIRAENTELHSIDPAVLSAWRKATHPLFNSYKEIVTLAERKSAHTQAWEAAFSFLFDQEIEYSLQNPSNSGLDPQVQAMRAAKMQVGQLRPLADRRTVVEAFWRSINVRLMVVKLAGVWLDAVQDKQQTYPPSHVDQWANYIGFILKTCEGDMQKALNVARNSQAHRQVLKSVALCMRITLETFRFNLDMCKKKGAFKEENVRKDLAEKALRQAEREQATFENAINDYFEHKDRALEEDRSWVQENFTDIVEVMIREWYEIEKSIKMDTFYQPVSMEEKMKIVQAFNYQTVGHFYQCENGHPFVITECGGAMVRSRCPECGAVIGGSNHHLDVSNQFAADFDEAARLVNPNVGRPGWPNPH